MYFEGLYKIDTLEQVAVHMCDVDGIRRGNYFGGEPIRITKLEVRMGRLSGKASGKNVMGERIKGGGYRVGSKEK